MLVLAKSARSAVASVPHRASATAITPASIMARRGGLLSRSREWTRAYHTCAACRSIDRSNLHRWSAVSTERYRFLHGDSSQRHLMISTIDRDQALSRYGRLRLPVMCGLDRSPKNLRCSYTGARQSFITPPGAMRQYPYLHLAHSSSSILTMWFPGITTRPT
jgi:hypothetical protein